MKYKIYELSARAILQNAVQSSDGRYYISLNEEQTKKCITTSVSKFQNDCALFYQITKIIPYEDKERALSEILIFIDFSNIFDRNSEIKKFYDLQQKAKDMFRPQGISLDLGSGIYNYVAFERSASMSRASRLAFIREDYYDLIRKRIMLDMTIGKCQLSKLYAYNGLMLTDGFRINDNSIWNSNRIIVIDNPTVTEYNSKVITVEPSQKDGSVVKYNRVERLMNVDITQFDGEGLISFGYAKHIDMLFCGKDIHTSFQIRMPYIKGVLHKVDIKGFFNEIGVTEIKDIWGEYHSVDDVDIILTKSMFKGFGWMTDNGMTWSGYLAKCKEYDHALYISEVSQTGSQAFTEMNYQFLVTASILPDEFRPFDLPFGWDISPETDNRSWITKATEQRYYDFVQNENYRLSYLIEHNKDYAEILSKNPRFANEKQFTRQLNTQAKKILKNYSLGKLITEGDNRYLSADLMALLCYIVKSSDESKFKAVVDLTAECIKPGEFYAPCSVYSDNDKYVLLRNPHIARNEEVIVKPVEEIGYFRKKYLSHLNYVVMVDAKGLIPERLGGADFDGDMIKTIANPLMNECVARNYTNTNIFDSFSEQLSVLKIPSAEPQIRDAKDWEARFETVRNTFNSRIGQICNAAFDRSIIAYDESDSGTEQEKMKEETETLEILTGLEIDSAKSGVKPDLTEYLNVHLVSRSLFLKYKNLVKNIPIDSWINLNHNEKLRNFYEAVDWDSVTSNIERLPYLSLMLNQQTPKLKPKPAKDEELFTFATEQHWQDKLNKADLAFMQSVIADYEAAKKRIQFIKSSVQGMKRTRDINRILFMRGQDNEYTVDELYGLFSGCYLEEIESILYSFEDNDWHIMPKEKRKDFLADLLPYSCFEYIDFFCDFRCNGYRILYDLVSDTYDNLRLAANKESTYHKEYDSELMTSIMSAYKRDITADYREVAEKQTLRYLRGRIDLDEALKCSVALKKREFALTVLTHKVESNMITTDSRKRRWFGA